jgi:hypothetical protein
MNILDAMAHGRNGVWTQWRKLNILDAMAHARNPGRNGAGVLNHPGSWQLKLGSSNIHLLPRISASPHRREIRTSVPFTTIYSIIPEFLSFISLLHVPYPLKDRRHRDDDRFSLDTQVPMISPSRGDLPWSIDLTELGK